MDLQCCNCCYLLRASLHHAPWNLTMEDALFPWSNLTVQHPWSHFLKNQFTKPLGPSLGVNQMWTKGMTMHQKWMCWHLWYIYIYPKKCSFEKKKSSLTILLSCLVFIFSSPENVLLNIYYNISPLSWALAFFLLEHLFCLTHHKTRWTVLVNNVVLQRYFLGTSNFMVTLTFFPWCRQKWSRNKFNTQSQTL